MPIGCRAYEGQRKAPPERATSERSRVPRCLFGGTPRLGKLAYRAFCVALSDMPREMSAELTVFSFACDSGAGVDLPLEAIEAHEIVCISCGERSVDCYLIAISAPPSEA